MGVLKNDFCMLLSLRLCLEYFLQKNVKNGKTSLGLKLTIQITFTLKSDNHKSCRKGPTENYVFCIILGFNATTVYNGTWLIC
jgi:hypothetical protein